MPNRRNTHKNKNKNANKNGNQNDRLFEIRRIRKKGEGWIATRNIESGKFIFREQVISWVMTDDSIHSVLRYIKSDRPEWLEKWYYDKTKNYNELHRIKVRANTKSKLLGHC